MAPFEKMGRIRLLYLELVLSSKKGPFGNEKSAFWLSQEHLGQKVYTRTKLTSELSRSAHFRKKWAKTLLPGMHFFFSFIRSII